MGTRKKRVILACLVVALVGTCTGCINPSLAYFLTPEQRLPAKMQHLASDDRKVEPKIVILAYAGPASTSIDCLHADREISELLGRNLAQLATANDEKLQLLPQRRVEEFKNANPNWKQMGNA